MSDGQNKSYGGQSASERRAERRQRLIQAAVEVYGGVGFKNASVRLICRTAGLTERYFYEAFPSSEALLVAACDSVNEDLMAAVRRASESANSPDEAPSRMVAEFFRFLGDNPEKARLFLVEVRGIGPEVDKVIARWRGHFDDLLLETLGAQHEDRFLARGIIGGLGHIALAWTEEHRSTPMDQVINSALRLSEPLRRKHAP